MTNLVKKEVNMPIEAFYYRFTYWMDAGVLNIEKNDSKIVVESTANGYINIDEGIRVTGVPSQPAETDYKGYQDPDIYLSENEDYAIELTADISESDLKIMINNFLGYIIYHAHGHEFKGQPKPRKYDSVCISELKTLPISDSNFDI